MSGNDPSHDFEHVMNVFKQAVSIFFIETRPHSTPKTDAPKYDLLAVMLSALLHDVGDKKYLHPGEDGTRFAAEFLQSRVPSELGEKVQEIVNAVSYSVEKQDPAFVADVLGRHAELGLVQDADRLAALGAIGIARLFAYSGAKGVNGGVELRSGIAHLHEKLFGLGSLMKTATGKRVAAERTLRLQVFEKWYLEEESGDLSNLVA